jgi:hypothetical protein
MTFDDGYWLLRQGVTARCASETLDLATSPDSASLAVLTRGGPTGRTSRGTRGPRGRCGCGAPR